MNTNDLNETLPNVLTTHEFMRAVRCSRSKAYRLIRTKEILSVRIGRRILIPKAAVLKLLTPEVPA